MNKQFTRMQKLAGIITEGFMGQFYAPEYLDQKYGKEMASKIHHEIDEMDENSWDRFTEFTSAEEVENYIADIKDMLGLTEGSGPVYVPGSNPDIDDKSATMALDMMTKEGISGNVPEGKMTKSQFKEKIKEAILAEKSLSEAKKKKKDEESEDVEDTVDVDVSADVDNLDVSTTGEDRVDMNMDAATDVDAGSSEAKKAFSELTDAYRAAKELGDEKLIRQIANTITYFNKNIILDQG